MFFLRKSKLDPLPVAMSGVRMGERALQIEIDEPAVSGAIAAKVGLSGHAAMAVSGEPLAVKARAAAADAGVLIDLQVTPLQTLPYPSDSFDVVVVNSATGWLGALDDRARQATLREGHRVLRGGGRILIIEAGSRQGLTAWLRPRPSNEAFERAGGAKAALSTAGFRASRVLADREGYRFTEGLKG